MNAEYTLKDSTMVKFLITMFFLKNLRIQKTTFTILFAIL